MSRPVLLVSLLLILIITSQFEWRQQLVSDVDATPREPRKQQLIRQREESVKEKYMFPSAIYKVCHRCRCSEHLRSKADLNYIVPREEHPKSE